MSENQQPLDEEQAVPDVQEQEPLPAAAEDTLPAAQDENAPAILDADPEEEEEDIDPADVKIFGMKRHVVQLTWLGAAVGYILEGIIRFVRSDGDGSAPKLRSHKRVGCSYDHPALLFVYRECAQAMIERIAKAVSGERIQTQLSVVRLNGIQAEASLCR